MKQSLASRVSTLKLIEKVFNKLKESRLSDQNFKTILVRLKPDLEKISAFFQCTEEEALFFSLVFGLKVVTNNVYYNDLIHYLDCNPFFIVSRESVFKSLQKKRLITKDDNWGRNSANLNITREAYNAVANNKPIHSAESAFENIYTLLQKVDDLIGERRREVISSCELFEEVQYLLTTESHLSVIANINRLHIPIREATVLLYLCYQFANGDEQVDLNEMLGMIFDRIGDKIGMKKELLGKSATIVKKGLVEFENDYFLLGRMAKLTDQAIEQLFESEANLFEKQKTFRPSHTQLLAPETIKAKTIFLNPSEKKQISVLKKLLQEDKLGNVMHRFDQAGIARGIVVLLYGEPGTGKTESVYNLAKETGRNILMVDIANLKDKYVGESEKHVKQLFTEYRKAAEYFDKLPILLFNESDAIISKRIEITSSVDQMNNSIQNILLQELENFEGILFATSNMNVNLDKAFERRFLYKVQFHVPDTTTRQKIWQSKLPDLSEPDVQYLSHRYTFSGGQIDNVVRKYLLESILQDEPSNLPQIERLCLEEAFGSYSSRIGF
jgi:hypothetical protein